MTLTEVEIGSSCGAGITGHTPLRNCMALPPDGSWGLGAAGFALIAFGAALLALRVLSNAIAIRDRRNGGVRKGPVLSLATVVVFVAAGLYVVAGILLHVGQR